MAGIVLCESGVLLRHTVSISFNFKECSVGSEFYHTFLWEWKVL
jgi:hypothetical protein